MKHLAFLFLILFSSCAQDTIVEPAASHSVDSSFYSDPIYLQEVENLKQLSAEYEKDKTIEKQTHLICRQINLMLAEHKGEKAISLVQAQMEVANQAGCQSCLTELLRTQGQVLFYENHSKAKVIESQANKEIERVVKSEKQKMLRNILFLGLIAVVLFGLLILRNSIQRKKANQELQEKNALIERQKMIVEEKQKEILDSIHYAKRIQNSLLPTEKYIEKSLGKLKKQ